MILSLGKREPTNKNEFSWWVPQNQQLLQTAPEAHLSAVCSPLQFESDILSPEQFAMYIKQNAGSDALATGTLLKLTIKTNAKNDPKSFFIIKQIKWLEIRPLHEVISRKKERNKFLVPYF